MVYDAAAPSTLVGSVVAASESMGERNATVVVTCASPCPSTGFPEQTITHILGSSWSGEYASSKTTTRWGCNVGTGGAPGKAVSDPSCSHDTKGPDDKSFVTGDVTSIDDCYKNVRSKVVFVTAGVDQWIKVEAKPTVSPDYIFSQQESMLKSQHCSTVQSGPTATSGTANSAGASSASAAITASPTTAAGSAPESASGTQASKTSGATRTGVLLLSVLAWAALAVS